MIWIRLSGGLGNQLFQWAAAEEVRYKTHQHIQFYTLDLKNYEEPRDFLFYRLLGNFYSNGSPAWITRLLLRYRVTKMVTALFPWHVNKNNISTLPAMSWFVVDDYFQNTLLIKTGMQLVIAKIAESAFRDCKVNIFFDNLLDGKLNKDVAAVHIRRSDYLTQKNRKIFHQLGTEYYLRALTQLDDCIKQIFIFSDGEREDLPVLEDYRITYVKSHGFTDLEEFLLLSLFDSIIIANSTYSFWAALISKDNRNKRIKIGPVHWLLDAKGNTEWNHNLLNAGFVIV